MLSKVWAGYFMKLKEGDIIMALCVFRFFFDINITFSPEVYFYSTINDDIDVLLRFHRIKGKKILSCSDNLDWINDQNESFFIGAPNEDGKQIPFRQFKKKLDGDLSFSGIIDEACYTIIEVIFKINDISLLHDNHYKEQKQKWILQNVLTNFIDNYTAVTEDVSFSRRVIFQPLFVDVLGVREEHRFPNAFIDKIELKKFGVQITWQNPYSTGYIKRNISLEQIEVIRNRLDHHVEVKLFEKLLLDAKEQAFISKNYDMSIILIENAFEVFLQSILIECCKAKKVQKLFKGKSKHQKDIDYIEAISNGNVQEDLIKNYLKFLTGRSIAGGREYNAWYSFTYEKRNDIIHKGKHGNTEDAAKKAFESTVNLINAIVNLLVDTSAYEPVKSISQTNLGRLAELIKSKNSIDNMIAAHIGRPALSGHIAEYVAAHIFDIELCATANQKAIDGTFRSGELAGKTVNIKYYGKKENLLDITPDDFPDYYLVLTGPKSQAVSSKGQTRPFLISFAFLFNGAEIISVLKSRGVKIGIATSIKEDVWGEAEVYPRHNSKFPLSEEIRKSLSLFGEK